MNKFHTLTVKDIRKETRDAVSISFDVPDNLKEHFVYKQGQYLVLKFNIDGEEIRRSYSICASVQDSDLRIAVKKVGGGLFSSYANELLEIGDSIDVMSPQGSFFTDLDVKNCGNYLAVAAGSGITPIISIIKTTLETEPLSQFTLFYGNRSSGSTIFRNELEDLKNTFLDRFNLVFIFSRESQDIDLYNGRIDAEKCKALFDRWVTADLLDAAFICGPQDMTETVRDELISHGLNPSKINFELFTAANGTKKPRKSLKEASLSDDTISSNITVIADGRSITFDLPHNTLSILVAGNEIGADLPYSCKAGVCSTCKARVVEGEVEMDANFALEDYEVAAGYVLSCQCYPVSEKVVLDYDQV